MKYLIYTFVFVLLFSCNNDKQIDKKAIILNDSAVQIYQHSFTNKDSVLKAITLLDKAIAIEPNYSIAFHNKVTFQINLGQIDEAINTCKAVEKIEPNNEQIKFMMGLLYYTQGDTISANKKYNEVDKLSQRKLNQWFNDSEEEINLKVNRAIVLKFLNKEKEANQLLHSINLEDLEINETQREFLQETINEWVKSTPKELLEKYNFNGYLIN